MNIGVWEVKMSEVFQMIKRIIFDLAQTWGGIRKVEKLKIMKNAKIERQIFVGRIRQIKDFETNIIPKGHIMDFF